MWNNNNILKELQKLAPTLANLPKTNVFKVPLEYFTDNETVWQKLEEEPNLNITKTNSFGLPDNYFIEFPKKLQSTIELLDTDEYSLDSSYKETEVFKTPSTYFEHFEAELFDKITNEEAAPVLSEFSKENNFKVPANYFEELSDNILANVQAEDSEVLMNSKSTGFDLPENYFNTFESRLKNRIQKEENEGAKKETKVIQLNPERVNDSEEAPSGSSDGMIRKIVRWGGAAVAAMLLLFLGVNFWFGNNQMNTSFDLTAELQKLKTSEIRAYVLDYADDFDEEAIFAARGIYDTDYQWYDNNKLNEIDMDVLKAYYEEDIL